MSNYFNNTLFLYKYDIIIYMKNLLKNEYNKLIEKYNIKNPAKLNIMKMNEYININEEDKNISYETPGYYNTDKHTIYIFYDYFSSLKNHYTNNISTEILLLFTLYHEFRHLYQKEYKYSFPGTIRLFETYLINKKGFVYSNDTHDTYYHEIDANLFAANQLLKIKKKYTKIDKLYINTLKDVYFSNKTIYNYDKLIFNINKLFTNDNNFIKEYFTNTNNSKTNKSIINLFHSSTIYITNINNKNEYKKILNILINRKNKLQKSNINIDKINNNLNRLNINFNIDKKQYINNKNIILKSLNKRIELINKNI